MIHILIACQDKDLLMEFSAGLETNDAKISWAKGCEQVFSKIKQNQFDLLIVDETLEDIKGLECIEKSVMNNPFLNTAAISSLSSKDFHEQSEGLGVLMQIPVNPSSNDGEKMLDYLNKILKLTNRDL
jgi:DNA-binding response OmpR family regulator